MWHLPRIAPPPQPLHDQVVPPRLLPSSRAPLSDVEGHPFDLDTMLFMDWRDGHTQGQPVMRQANERTPTFLYAMPFSPTKIFLEETSLVARPAVPFPELKQRLWTRLQHLGIKVGREGDGACGSLAQCLP